MQQLRLVQQNTGPDVALPFNPELIEADFAIPGSLGSARKAQKGHADARPSRFFARPNATAGPGRTRYVGRAPSGLVRWFPAVYAIVHCVGHEGGPEQDVVGWNLDYAQVAQKFVRQFRSRQVEWASALPRRPRVQVDVAADCGHVDRVERGDGALGREPGLQQVELERVAHQVQGQYALDVVLEPDYAVGLHDPHLLFYRQRLDMVTDLPVAQLAVNRNDGIGIIPELLAEDRYAFVLQKGSPLTAKVNERMTAYREDGTIEKLYQKWTGGGDAAKTLPAQDWPAPNGTLKVAAAADAEPMSYLEGNEVTGMCIELMYLIARDLGYHLQLGTNNAGSLVADIQTNKADIGASIFSVTEERKQMVDMTEPFYEGGVAVVVRTAGR